MTDSRTLGILDESDEWTDEDLRDVTIASLNYADEFEIVIIGDEICLQNGLKNIKGF